jgi:hypothetical protein
MERVGEARRIEFFPRALARIAGFEAEYGELCQLAVLVGVCRLRDRTTHAPCHEAA